LFPCSVSHGSRSDFAEEFPAQMQTQSVYLFTGSRSRSSESDSADELPAQMPVKSSCLFPGSGNHGLRAHELPVWALRLSGRLIHGQDIIRLKNCLLGY
jgi:hypothetical protein